MTTPRTDAAVYTVIEYGDLGFREEKKVVPYKKAAELETELIAIIKERDQLRATVEGLGEALSHKILGKSLRQYMFEQFPATDGHIPFMQFCGRQEQALQSLPPSALVKRSVLEKSLAAMYRAQSIVPPHFGDQDRCAWELDEAIKEAHEELERTK